MECCSTRRSSAGRMCGWAFGAGAQLAFAYTVIRLFNFLSQPEIDAPRQARWLAVDVALALQFAVPHSVLRLPRIQQMAARVIGREFFGAAYCWITCASLTFVFEGWMPSGFVVWESGRVLSAGIDGAFLASWASLAYSLWLTGIGYQTGFTEWNYWRRRMPLPRRQFAPRGAYRWFRHPVYLSFLGLVWFHPCMTLDHLMLALVWTAYIGVGSYLKDERLAYYMGEEYRRYQARVPGYPLVTRGPLGLWRQRSSSVAMANAGPSTQSAGLAPKN